MTRERRRLAVPATMLLFSACLLPEIVMAGGWRAWLASAAVVGVLVTFVSELRAAIRRRAIKASSPHGEDSA